jgi:hypothetical protein
VRAHRLAGLTGIAELIAARFSGLLSRLERLRRPE